MSLGAWFKSGEMKSSSSIKERFLLKLFLCLLMTWKRGRDILLILFNKILSEPLSEDSLSYISEKLLPHFDSYIISAKAADRLKKHNMTIPASFHFLIKHRKRRYEESEAIHWKLNNKLVGADFARDAGFRCPKIYQSNIPFSEIDLQNNIVIKPATGAGARGVYICFNPKEVWYAKTGEKLNGYGDLKNHAYHQIQTNVVSDEWIVEECIVNDNDALAYDLKFYTFYGKVAMIHEVKRLPSAKHCFWSRDHHVIKTGRYSERDTFIGDGFKDHYVKQIEELSMLIPTPFIRIDCLNTGQELVFGEFTPSPGSHDKFNQKTDHFLGQEYLAAENLLFRDLLNNKSFGTVKKAVYIN